MIAWAVVGTTIGSLMVFYECHECDEIVLLTTSLTNSTNYFCFNKVTGVEFYKVVDDCEPVESAIAVLASGIACCSLIIIGLGIAVYQTCIYKDSE